jgi:alkylhydroperoxidase/carboxymuconolactone decarboxylase family protein YurZ
VVVRVAPEQHSFRVWQAGGLPIVCAPTEIDITNAVQLRTALLSATSNNATVVVDMSQTAFCDSAAPLGGSMTGDQRYEDGLRVLQQIDGEAGQKVADSLADVSPELGRQVAAWAFGDIYSRPGLAPAPGKLVILGALTALGGCVPQFEVHINGALNVGITRRRSSRAASWTRSTSSGCSSPIRRPWSQDTGPLLEPRQARRWLQGKLGRVRITVTEVGWDGSIRRRAADTSGLTHVRRWEDLIEQVLAVPPPYRATPGSPVYVIHAGDRAVLVGEENLIGSLQELVTTILAAGDPALAALRPVPVSHARLLTGPSPAPGSSGPGQRHHGPAHRRSPAPTQSKELFPAEAPAARPVPMPWVATASRSSNRRVL